jgi:hypothetical protein
MCANESSDETLLPFARYPSGGSKLLGRLSGGNSRRGYGLKLVQKTGQTHCVYCGTNLVDTYEHWLTLSTDHVVPVSLCKAWGIQKDWQEDYTNRVICCIACNTFGNRYAPQNITPPATSLTEKEFYTLRDQVFLERKNLILKRRDEEKTFFKKKRWLTKNT